MQMLKAIIPLLGVKSLACLERIANILEIENRERLSRERDRKRRGDNLWGENGCTNIYSLNAFKCIGLVGKK